MIVMDGNVAGWCRCRVILVAEECVTVGYAVALEQADQLMRRTHCACTLARLGVQACGT